MNANERDHSSFPFNDMKVHSMCEGPQFTQSYPTSVFDLVTWELLAFQFLDINSPTSYYTTSLEICTPPATSSTNITHTDPQLLRSRPPSFV